MKTRGKLAETKAHITMWTTDELEDVVKISEIQESTVRVTETMRERERERERRRMFVCDNILKKTKRESKDLSQENKTNQLQINTLSKQMMKGAES